MTSSTWMFISSFERLRKRLIEACTIDSLLHTQGPNNHPDVFDANAVMVLKSAHIADYEGGYFKLDKLGLDVKEKMLREAIQNPDCSWFYRRNADTFKQIPGTPIAYWASEVMIGQFNVSPQLSSISAPMVGGQTNDNEKFVRFWWEVPTGAIGFGVETYQEAASSNTAWFPFNKGGNYRKWYGNNELVVFWRDGGRDIKAAGGSTSNKDFYFKPSVTWSRTSSGTIACRMKPYGFVFDTEGASIVCDEPTGMMLQGVINSSCFLEYMKLLAPTLHFGLSDVSKVPK